MSFMVDLLRALAKQSKDVVTQAFKVPLKW